MKNLLFTLALALFTATCAFAQTFSMNPDTVSVTATGDEYDVATHNEMTNMTSVTRTMKWERTILINPDSLETQVCDPVACYAPWIDTRTFDLAGNATVPMIVHLLNPNGIEPYYAVVQLKYTDLADPNNPQFSIYVFNIGTDATDDLIPAANVKLYPNPVVESFSLDNADEVRRVLVFSTDGRQVAVFDAAANNSYSIAGQPAGTYVVALEAENGKVFQAVEVRKN